MSKDLAQKHYKLIECDQDNDPDCRKDLIYKTSKLSEFEIYFNE